MSKRETDIKRIADYFALAENVLNNKAILGYNDDSRAWEDVICRVINIAYSWKLVNLNKSTNNYPGIDLGDEERRIGVQVTKEHTSDKVNSTLDKIIRNKVYERYSEIYVFVLGHRQKTYQIKEEFQAQSLFHFDKQDNIWDFQTLLMHCQNIESEKLAEIASYLEYELAIFQGNGKQDAHNDRLNKYIDHQKSESGFIKILGLRNSLPIDNVWIQLKLLNVDDRNQVKKEGEQAGPLSVYDEYKVYGERGSSCNVNTIIASGRNTVVLAGPGMGKSTLCKKLFMLADGEGKCAARVRLWDIAKYMRQGMVFEESLRMAMAAPLSFCLSKSELDNIFSVLILDGLDECGDMSRTVAKDISEWSNGHDHVQVIVTSRPVGYDDAELYDYLHYQILPLDVDDLESAAETLFASIKDSYDEELKWFRSQLKSPEIKRLACRSPLILGFIVQLSNMKRQFGRYKKDLYDEIMTVWLQGSSRDNEKVLSDAELYAGIKAIAFYMLNHMNDDSLKSYTQGAITKVVGQEFERELGLTKLQGIKTAEQCLEFWTGRGILERNYYENEECYIFLHLNIGEYLAASYLADRTPNERREWINENYRTVSWHETIRMLVACEKDDCALDELIQIEMRNELPGGSIFLAAEGAAESGKARVPQSLYTKLLEYVSGDNRFLSQKAASAAGKLKGKDIDWQQERLEDIMANGTEWKKLAAYHVYLSMPEERQSYEFIRKYVIDYPKKYSHRRSRYSHDDYTVSIGLLHNDPDDHDVIEAIKDTYYEHCTMYQMDVLDEYLKQLGMEAWTKEYLASIPEWNTVFDYKPFNRKLIDSELAFIHILERIYGSLETDTQFEVYTEYSKIISVVEILDTPVHELIKLQDDLEEEYAIPIIKALCNAIDLDIPRLRKEIYLLLSSEANNGILFVSTGKRIEYPDCIDWNKTFECVSSEDLITGLQSRSDIMGDVVVQLVDVNWNMDGVREGVCRLLYYDSPRVVYRAGVLLAYKEPMEAAQIIMDRMTMPDKPLYSTLFEVLSMCKGIGNVEQWVDIIKKALSDEEYVVNAVLKYLKMNINEYVSDKVIKGIMPDVKRQFHSWFNKPLMCDSCKPPVQLDENGFCPKCHTGRSLPFADFFDVLLRWDYLSLEEIHAYMEHPMSDLSKAARKGMLVYLQKYPDRIQECIDAIKNNTYNARVFDVILKLPQQYVLPYKQEILEIANSDNHRCIIYFIRRLNGLEWIDEPERKEYITRMISHEDQDIRSEAMAAHLGEKTDRHVFDEVFYRE